MLRLIWWLLFGWPRDYWIIRYSDLPWVVSRQPPIDGNHSSLLGPFETIEMAEAAARKCNGDEDEEELIPTAYELPKPKKFFLARPGESKTWIMTDCDPEYYDSDQGESIGPFGDYELARQAACRLNGEEYVPTGTVFYRDGPKLTPEECDRLLSGSKNPASWYSYQQTNTQSTPSSSSQEKANGNDAPVNDSVQPPEPDRQ